MKKINLFLFLVFIFNQTSTAATYKVGTEQDFKNILPKLAAGDEVIIKNGSYQNWSIEIPTIGTIDKPIIIKPETVGQVIFSGEVENTMFKISGAFITLYGIMFSNCSLLKAEGRNGVLIELKNTKNCSVINCQFIKNAVKAQFMPLVIISGNGEANKVAQCVFTANIDNQDVQVKITRESCPQNTIISNNLFQNKERVSWKNENGGECIQVGQDPVLLGTMGAHTIVRQNTFIRCNAESEVISNKSSKNSYINNKFNNNDGELVMRGGHDCLIDSNVFEGGTGGIRINGTGHTITNNKINNIKTAIRLMYGMAKGKLEIGFYIAASNCNINHNQISNATTGILIGDSKDADWTGKFDTKRYPSPLIQSIAPFDNNITNNTFLNTKVEEVNQ